MNIETASKQIGAPEPATASGVCSVEMASLERAGKSTGSPVEAMGGVAVPSQVPDQIVLAVDDGVPPASSQPFWRWVWAAYQLRFTAKAGDLAKYLFISFLGIAGVFASRVVLLSLFKLIVYTMPSAPGTLDYFTVVTTADAVVSLGLPSLVFGCRRWLCVPWLPWAVIATLNLSLCGLSGFLGFHYFWHFDLVAFALWLAQALLLYGVYHCLGRMVGHSTLRHLAFPLTLIATAIYAYGIYDLIYSDRSFGLVLPESPSGTAPINTASAAIRQWQTDRAAAIGAGLSRGQPHDPVPCACLGFIREHFQLLAWVLLNIFAYFMQWSANLSRLSAEDPAYSRSDRHSIVSIKWCVFFQLAHTLVVVGTVLASTRTHHRLMCQLAANSSLSDLISTVLRQYRVLSPAPE